MIRWLTMAACIAATASCATMGDSTAERTLRDPTITEKKAVEVALQRFPDAEVRRVELEHERGEPIYEVALTATTGERWEVEVHGDTAKVMEVERDDDDDDDDDGDDDGDDDDDDDGDDGDDD